MVPLCLFSDEDAELSVLKSSYAADNPNVAKTSLNCSKEVLSLND